MAWFTKTTAEQRRCHAVISVTLSLSTVVTRSHPKRMDEVECTCVASYRKSVKSVSACPFNRLVGKDEFPEHAKPRRVS